MKTFTMLAAVAALAGAMITYADAQSTMGGSQQPKAGAMNQSSSTSGKMTGTGKFCIEMSAGGGWDCKYASLQACEKDGKVQNRQCQQNTNSSTTGSKQ